MQLKVLKSSDVIGFVFVGHHTLAIKTIFIFLVFPVLYISVVIAVSGQNLLGRQLHPFLHFLLLFLSLLATQIHLLLYHVIVVYIAFYGNLDKEVFPVVLE